MIYIGKLKRKYFLKPIMILSLLMIISNFAYGKNNKQQYITVKITDGVLKGIQNNRSVSFKGIPYGADTAGINRFKAPQPVQPWEGIRDATQYSYLSPQYISGMGENNDTLFSWYAQSEPTTMSEDCLRLNVFSPDLNKTAQRPVLLYIHGGGYINGGGSGEGLDGSFLANYGDVVVVTINHRLNIFGYTNLLQTSDPDFADAANAGNLDIIAALKWVHDNIQQFGGDPNNVTVFGQSGGGSKIMTLLAMPEAKGLFHKAISMSGAAGLNVDQASNVEPYTNAILQTLNITKNNLDELQTLSINELLTARDRAVKISGIDGARPVIDGKHIVAKPLSSEGLAMQANIPLLLGYTRTEASLFFKQDSRNFTMSEAQMRGRMKESFKINDAKVDRIIEVYRQWQPTMKPYDIFVAVASDVQFRLPLENAAKIKSSESNQAPVYMYQFAWTIPAMNGVLGSPHAVDIPFAFGTLDSANEMVGNDNDGAEKTSIAMMNVFISFARTGNPNNQYIPTWAPYDSTTQTVMVINQDSHAENQWREAISKEISDLKIDPFNRNALYRYSD